MRRSLPISCEFICQLGAARPAYEPHCDWPQLPETAILFRAPKSLANPETRLLRRLILACFVFIRFLTSTSRELTVHSPLMAFTCEALWYSRRRTSPDEREKTRHPIRESQLQSDEPATSLIPSACEWIDSRIFE